MSVVVRAIKQCDKAAVSVQQFDQRADKLLEVVVADARRNRRRNLHDRLLNPLRFLALGHIGNKPFQADHLARVIKHRLALLPHPAHTTIAMVQPVGHLVGALVIDGCLSFIKDARGVLGMYQLSKADGTSSSGRYPVSR